MGKNRRLEKTKMIIYREERNVVEDEIAILEGTLRFDAKGKSETLRINSKILGSFSQSPIGVRDWPG